MPAAETHAPGISTSAAEQAGFAFAPPSLATTVLGDATVREHSTELSKPTASIQRLMGECRKTL
jgi:hypothetical protein